MDTDNGRDGATDSSVNQRGLNVLNDYLLNDFLLQSFPNPERKGCPDEKKLRAFAEGRLPGDPVLSHISSCSECYAEYRHYRRDWKEASRSAANLSQAATSSKLNPIAHSESHRNRILPWAVAAGLLAVVAGGMILKGHHPTAPPAQSYVASNAGPVSASVDLFNAVTVRGGGGDEATPLQQPVSLPSSIVHLSVTLPRFSQSGPYEILVSRDRLGNEGVAHGGGDAVESGGKVGLTVTLDLRNTSPGTYFLATVRGSDNGTYYYPLNVK